MFSVVFTAISTYEAITQLAQINHQLENLNEEMAHYNFAASHDLQTPLRTIARFTQLVDRDYSRALDERGQEYLRFVVAGVKTMESLIQDLLELSGGPQQQDHDDVDCGEVMSEVCNVLAGTIYSRSADIQIGDMPRVRGRQRDLVRLMQNLVDNALKFQPGEKPTVQVSAERSGATWVLSVADQGIGIDPAYHQVIFKPFKRLHNSDEFPGNGVGLAICRKIAEQHGTRVELESTPGEGATFRIRLPAIDSA